MVSTDDLLDAAKDAAIAAVDAESAAACSFKRFCSSTSFAHLSRPSKPGGMDGVVDGVVVGGAELFSP